MTTKLDPTARYAPHAQAMESRLGDETVILHLEQGAYFGLDAVGTVVWERLQGGDTPAAICAYVRANFDDVPETVEGDITAFLEALLEKSLIERC